MKLFLTFGRAAFAVALMLFSLGCASGQSQTENLLTTAGFHNVLANTPRQKQLLASLPAGEMSTVLKNGRTWFVFPNQGTNSAFVGTQQQFTTYRQMVMAQNISDQNLRISQMNSRPPSSGPGWNDSWGGAWAWR